MSKIAVKIKINAKPGDMVKYTGDVAKYESLYGYTGLNNDVWGVIHLIYIHDLTADVFFGGKVYEETIDSGGMYPGLLTIPLSDLEVDDGED